MPEVIGIYDHPPPPAATGLRSKQLHGNQLVLRTAASYTRAKDYISNHLLDSIDWAW